jgi:hypothetical protein
MGFVKNMSDALFGAVMILSNRACKARLLLFVVERTHLN